MANIEPKSAETPSASAEIQSNLTRNKADLMKRVASPLKQASVEDDVIAVPVVRAKGKKMSLLVDATLALISVSYKCMGGGGGGGACVCGCMFR